MSGFAHAHPSCRAQRDRRGSREAAGEVLSVSRETLPTSPTSLRSATPPIALCATGGENG
jgi:hypothetical protein